MDKLDYQRYPKRLNLGCGFDVREGFLNVDFHSVHKPDLVANVTDLSMLPSGYYSEIIAQDILEHIPRTITVPVLCEWNRLLAKNGILEIRVPSVIGVLSLFQKKENQPVHEQEKLIQLLYGTQSYEGDFHQTAFTESILRHYLDIAGFEVSAISDRDSWLFDARARKVSDCNFMDLIRIEEYSNLIVKAFQLILERNPDEEGLVYYTTELESGRLNRMTFIGILLLSEERRRLSERKPWSLRRLFSL
jgi:predicted SAM-dependent methyltransferase